METSYSLSEELAERWSHGRRHCPWLLPVPRVGVVPHVRWHGSFGVVIHLSPPSLLPQVLSLGCPVLVHEDVDLGFIASVEDALAMETSYSLSEELAERWSHGRRHCPWLLPVSRVGVVPHAGMDLSVS
jgi:hypothetical protein